MNVRGGRSRAPLLHTPFRVTTDISSTPQPTNAGGAIPSTTHRMLEPGIALVPDTHQPSKAGTTSTSSFSHNFSTSSTNTTSTIPSSHDRSSSLESAAAGLTPSRNYKRNGGETDAARLGNSNSNNFNAPSRGVQQTGHHYIQQQQLHGGPAASSSSSTAPPPINDSTSPDALLGPSLRTLFSFSAFNVVQAAVAPTLLALSDYNNTSTTATPLGIHPGNVVVGAPTGSGKTVLLELAIVALFRSHIEASFQHAQPPHADVNNTHHQSHRPTKKAVYICPIKALAQEKFDSWSSKFGSCLKVVMETGDGLVAGGVGVRRTTTTKNADGGTSPIGGANAYVDPATNMEEILTADILIATPERWDSITRRWRDGQASLGLVASIGLLLVDEVHVVGERRGAVLEAVVSRMKSISITMAEKNSRALGGLNITHPDNNQLQQQHAYVPIRFVAVSGTIPNIDDLASWLDVQPHNVFTFGDEVRPVQLRTKVVGFRTMSNNPFAFDRFLNFKLHGLIREHSDGKPSLVFCSSRKDTASTAQHLAEEIARMAAGQGSSSDGGGYGGYGRGSGGSSWRGGRGGRGGGNSPQVSFGQLEEMSKHIMLPDGNTSMYQCAMSAEDKILRTCLLAGIAFHNAALTPSDRRLVEDLFSRRYVSILCTTTTLAMGVNLPARLVVIKGTTFYRGGCREDLPNADIIQMTGRAGRPGLDTEGVALILTSNDKAHLYNGISSTSNGGSPPLESHLHHAMIEHLNAEIALKTVTTVSMGVAWLKTTFLWARLQKAPGHYGLKPGGISDASAPQTLALSSTGGPHKFQTTNNIVLPLAVLESFAAALINDMVTRLLANNCVKLELITREQVLFNSDANSCSVPNTATNDEEEDLDEDGTVNLPSPYEAFKQSFFSSSSSTTTTTNTPTTHHAPVATITNSPLAKYTLSSTRIGRLVTKYYIDFATLVTFNETILWRMVSKQSMLKDLEGIKVIRGGKKDGGDNEKSEVDEDSFASSSVSSDGSGESSSSDNDDDDGSSDDNNDKKKNRRNKKGGVTSAGLDGRLPPHGVRQLLELLSRSNEFSELRIRLGDKGVLNSKNKVQKFPLRHIPTDNTPTTTTTTATAGREVKEGWQKIFLLAQIKINDPSMQSLNEDFSLRNDASRMWQTMPRISKFLTEYCTICCSEASNLADPLFFLTTGSNTPRAGNNQDHSLDGRGGKVLSSWSHMVADAWCLQRSIEQGIWWDSIALTRQLDGVGDAISRSLCTNANVHGIEDVVRFACCGTVSVLGSDTSGGTLLSTVDLVEASEAGRRLEMLCSKPPPFGRTLLNQCLAVPRLLPPPRHDIGHGVSHLNKPPAVVVRKDDQNKDGSLSWISCSHSDVSSLIRRATKTLGASLSPNSPSGNRILLAVALLNQRQQARGNNTISGSAHQHGSSITSRQIDGLVSDVGGGLPPITVGYLVGSFTVALAPRVYYTLKDDPLMGKYGHNRGGSGVGVHHPQQYGSTNTSGGFRSDPTMDDFMTGGPRSGGVKRPVQVVSPNQLTPISVSTKTSWFTILVYVDDRKLNPSSHLHSSAGAMPTEHLLLHRRVRVAANNQDSLQPILFNLSVPIQVSLQRMLQMQSSTGMTPQHPAMPVKWLEVPEAPSNMDLSVNAAPKTVSEMVAASSPKSTSSSTDEVMPVGNSAFGGYQVMMKTALDPSFPPPPLPHEQDTTAPRRHLQPFVPVVVLVINETYLGVDDRIEMLLPVSCVSVSVRCPPAAPRQPQQQHFSSSATAAHSKEEDTYFSPAHLTLLTSMSMSQAALSHRVMPTSTPSLTSDNPPKKSKAQRAEETARKKGEKFPREDDPTLEAKPTAPKITLLRKAPAKVVSDNSSSSEITPQRHNNKQHDPSSSSVPTPSSTQRQSPAHGSDLQQAPSMAAERKLLTTLSTDDHVGGASMAGHLTSFPRNHHTTSNSLGIVGGGGNGGADGGGGSLVVPRNFAALMQEKMALSAARQQQQQPLGGGGEYLPHQGFTNGTTTANGGASPQNGGAEKGYHTRGEDTTKAPPLGMGVQRLHTPPMMSVSCPLGFGSDFDGSRSIGENLREGILTNDNQCPPQQHQRQPVKRQQHQPPSAVVPSPAQQAAPPRRRILIACGNDDDDDDVVGVLLGGRRGRSMFEGPVTPLGDEPHPPSSHQRDNSNEPVPQQQAHLAEKEDMDDLEDEVRERVPSRDACSEERPDIDVGNGTPLTRAPGPPTLGLLNATRRPPTTATSTTTSASFMHGVSPSCGGKTTLLQRPKAQPSDTNVGQQPPVRSEQKDTSDDDDEDEQGHNTILPSYVFSPDKKRITRITLPPSPAPREVPGGAQLTSKVPAVSYNPMTTVLQRGRPEKAKRIQLSEAPSEGSSFVEDAEKSSDSRNNTATTATTFQNGGRESPSGTARNEHPGGPRRHPTTNTSIINSGLDTIALSGFGYVPPPKVVPHTLAPSSINHHLQQQYTPNKPAVCDASVVTPLQPHINMKLSRHPASITPLSSQQQPHSTSNTTTPQKVVGSNFGEPLPGDRTERRLKAVQQFLALQKQNAAQHQQPTHPYQHGTMVSQRSHMGGEVPYTPNFSHPPQNGPSTPWGSDRGFPPHHHSSHFPPSPWGAVSNISSMLHYQQHHHGPSGGGGYYLTNPSSLGLGGGYPPQHHFGNGVYTHHHIHPYGQPPYGGQHSYQQPSPFDSSTSPTHKKGGPPLKNQRREQPMQKEEQESTPLQQFDVDPQLLDQRTTTTTNDAPQKHQYSVGGDGFGWDQQQPPHQQEPPRQPMMAARGARISGSSSNNNPASATPTTLHSPHESYQPSDYYPSSFSNRGDYGSPGQHPSSFSNNHAHSSLYHPPQAPYPTMGFGGSHNAPPPMWWNAGGR